MYAAILCVNTFSYLIALGKGYLSFEALIHRIYLKYLRHAFF